MRYKKKILVLILLLGLLLRGLYFFYLAQKGEFFVYLTNNDSISFTNGFINLLEKGVFSFDLQNPDAAFGRLPGYPFFWGIHFLLFGKYANIACAFSQILLDSIAVLMIYSIVFKLFNSEIKAILISSVYAFYPFIIFWNPIIGTESFATFLTILFFYVMYVKDDTIKHPIYLAFIVTVAFYTREYLGILILSVYLFYLVKYGFRSFKMLKYCLVATFIFTFFYSLWPIRNYISFNRFILLKTPTSGYNRYGEDIIAMRKWIYCWSNDASEIFLKITKSADTSNIVGENLFKEKKDYKFFMHLVERARVCGTGTYNWKHNERYPYSKNCNNEIESGFEYLIAKYKMENPISYYLNVPLQNINKAFFKNELQKGENNLFVKILFGLRSALLIAGWLAMILWIFKDKKILPLFFFVGFMYFFICFIMRQLEMRYLLQADCILIIPLAYWFNKVSNFKKT